ncbi:MAG: hypothetical protein ACOC8X_13875 [Chloroflexota bacterium]
MSTTSVPSNRPLTKQERSAVFSEYNRLRHTAESGRANRALGLVQRGEERPYETTPDFCSCPDWINRMQYVEGGKCKHQIQLELAQVAAEAAPEPDPGKGGLDVDEINDLLFG